MATKLPTPPQPLKILPMAKTQIEYAEGDREGEIHFREPFLACRGHVPTHTDDVFFPKWSAFFCLRNDGCLVWQKGGWRGIPQPGDYFTLNIHAKHGVRASSKKILAVVCADGRTPESAERKLDRTLRRLMREAANA